MEFQLFIRTGKASRGVCECAMAMVLCAHTHCTLERSAVIHNIRIGMRMYVCLYVCVCDMRRNNVEKKIAIYLFEIVESVARPVYAQSKFFYGISEHDIILRIIVY